MRFVGRKLGVVWARRKISVIVLGAFVRPHDLPFYSSFWATRTRPASRQHIVSHVVLMPV
jgi:hypothetical protein